MIVSDQRPADHRLVEALRVRPAWARWAACYVLVCSVVFFGIYRSATFIYFQF
jgi:hypothetical protein